MKKLQNSLYITKDGVYLHKQRETLLIEQKVAGEKQKLMQLPIHSIGSIFCFGNIMVSPQLLGFCGENGTHLAFFDMHGRFLANVVGKQTGNVLLRRQQFNVDELTANELAKHIVAAKIRSSRMLLLRFRRNHTATPQIEKAIERLKQIIEQLKGVTAYDTILGLEGEAASHYFAAFADMFKGNGNKQLFDKRTRRPPKDPVNAVISLLYSVLGQEVSGALQGVGLDPQVGFLHKERPGRNSLALDLLEEFRAYIVDSIVLKLFNNQTLTIKDFETDCVGGVTIKDDARKQVFQAYQAKKQEELMHPFLKEKVQIGLLPHIQAMLLARHLRGDLDYYPPFVIKK
ncbi:MULTISPECIES: type I-C CRISPR-associated endonuclease Cas1c [Pseudoalteromonas]|uniref:type I-C CRISPR-associated endonuclease Cas1c n=1 Tax=Pseudoalteromonas TaxID=53246 RepID=UPI00029AB4E0|nr:MULTISPECIES: type I-C CRISPR-associated endonuclease Cas1c [Pseudoalteromonas]MCF2828044.1 type I-C CRISPR-associated endonuclease Cas1c [Pseudoalteromonas sp. OF5H-5]MCF2833367.1 type I-C CRISPR-associated endonuclease Cas1c [Pseudoalteromonas sp. DL2-H6]MCF2924173.1 type I-C CRISPR-associated endonuclease Cas1c [Pseudoalteromonas sp. DL2-H1]